MKRWNLHPQRPAEAAALAAELGVAPVLGQILLNRGLGDPAEARRFLRPDLNALLDPSLLPDMGRAVDLKTSVGFAILLGVVLLASAALNSTMGNAGMMLGAAVSGLADAHAASASAASLAAAGKISTEQAMLPILLALSANTCTKAVVAFNAGGRAYAAKIIPGLVAMMIAVWTGFYFSSAAV